MEITGKLQDLILIYILPFALLGDKSCQDQINFPEIIKGFTLSSEKPQ